MCCSLLLAFAQEEFLRVLRPGGRLIYAVPGAEHLFQMKAVLYEKPYKNPVQEVAYPALKPSESGKSPAASRCLPGSWKLSSP